MFTHYLLELYQYERHLFCILFFCSFGKLQISYKNKVFISKKKSKIFVEFQFFEFAQLKYLFENYKKYDSFIRATLEKDTRKSTKIEFAQVSCTQVFPNPGQIRATFENFCNIVYDYFL